MVQEREEKRSGFAGQRLVAVPPAAMAAAVRQRPLPLRWLRAGGAGFFPKAAGHLRRRPEGSDETILIYCLKGGGWCELAGQIHSVRAGEVLVLPTPLPHAYGAHQSNPWTIHWVHAAGEHLPAYLKELGVSPHQPVAWVGENMHLVALFNEVLLDLLRSHSAQDLFHASHTFSHLLSVLLRCRQERPHEPADSVQKVAAAITHMSEHLDQPLKVAELAARASLSPAHFTVLFKQQAGCAPRDYLHLLRIHRACHLLRSTALSVKEVATMLGYQDQFHFSRTFKDFQGVSPSQYRQAAARP